MGGGAIPALGGVFPPRWAADLSYGTGLFSSGDPGATTCVPVAMTIRRRNMLRRALAAGLLVLGGLACSGAGAPGEDPGHVLDPKSGGEPGTPSSAEPAPPPSSVPPVSSPGAAAPASSDDQPTSVVGTANKSTRSSSKPVPERSCTGDDQCGEDGFCDRDRCAPVLASKHSYGWPCGTSDECFNLPCIDGRCRSCRSDTECERLRDLMDPRCLANWTKPGTRLCTSGIPSIPGIAGPASRPRP
jgi:hypothetical protein